jgi:hypothetical protein
MSDRQRLPYIDLKNWAGLYTKSSTDILSPEQLKVADNVDFFNKYGAISKLKGSSNVLSSQFLEPTNVGAGPNTTPAKMSWIGWYKSSDLDGSILRQVLVAAGTVLKRLDSAGTALEDVGNTSTATSDTTGRTNGLFHSADTLDRFMFITNQNPDKVGEGDQLLKYDNSKVSNWGLTPPGSQETTLDTFASGTISNWLTAGCTTTADTDVTFDGDAMSITQTAGGDFFYVEDSTFPAFDPVGDARLKGFISNRVNLFVFIPRGELDDFNKSRIDKNSNVARAFSGYFGTDVNNNWRFDFQKGELFEGWNKLSFDFAGAFYFGPLPFPESTTFESPIGASSGTFNPDPTDADDDISYVKFEFLSENTTDRISNVRIDKFQKLDEGAPTASAQGSGTFTSARQYKVSFVNKYGNESNTGPASGSVEATNSGSFYIGFIPTSTDQQVVSRRLYRTVGGGTLFLRLTELYDNKVTQYTDRIPDGSLSEITAPQAGDFSDDNSPPPQAGIVKVWKKTVFMAGDPQNPNVLYFSEDDEPESFPLINAFDLDAKITAIYETYSGLVVETETAKWQVIGDNPDFAVDKVVEGSGCVGRRAAGVSRLIGYSVDRDGMRLYDNNDMAKISEPIRDKYEDLDKVNLELIYGVHSKARNAILEFNPDDTTPAPTPEYTGILNYQYAVDDVKTGWWSEVKTNSLANLNFLDAREIEDSNGDFRIYAGGDDGMIYEILTTSSQNWTDATGATHSVDTVFETPYLRLGALGAQLEGVTGDVEPTFLEVRHDGDATTWTFTISVAEGPDQATPTATTVVNMQFGTNNSLLRYPLRFGGSAIRKEYIKIKAENTEKNVNSTITAIRIYFHVREGQYPIIDIKTA